MVNPGCRGSNTASLSSLPLLLYILPHFNSGVWLRRTKILPQVFAFKLPSRFLRVSELTAVLTPSAQFSPLPHQPLPSSIHPLLLPFLPRRLLTTDPSQLREEDLPGDLQSLSWLTSVDVPRLQQMADGRGHNNGPSQGSLLEQQTGEVMVRHSKSWKQRCDWSNQSPGIYIHERCIVKCWCKTVRHQCTIHCLVIGIYPSTQNMEYKDIHAHRWLTGRFLGKYNYKNKKCISKHTYKLNSTAQKSANCQRCRCNELVEHHK